MPPSVKTGRPSKLLQVHLNGLLDYLSGYPQAYLNGTKEFCKRSAALQWRSYHLSRLEEAPMELESCNKASQEQSEPLRQVYRVRFGYLYKAEQIVTLDETA